MLKATPIWALGCMSGTSLDGVDAAMVLTDGEAIVEFGSTAYRPYTPSEQQTLRRALGQWPGDPDVEAATEIVETAHAELLSRCQKPAIIGFHGQTLAHDPANARTHQAGSGDILAQILNTPVVWDFRSADVKLGGQGAPLAPFFHFACAKFIHATEPLAFLNMGGVGNLTWVDPTEPGPETLNACLAFDTGPANAPVNDLMLSRLNQPHDEGGEIAAKGTPDAAIIAAALNHPYFFKIPPKSLDRNDFQALLTTVETLTTEDAAATLTAIAAQSVAAGFLHFPRPVSRLLVTGGGRHNATLMHMLAAALPCKVDPIEAVGLDGDMLEAQAFGYLAVRVARGLPTSGPTTTGVPALVGGGQISRP